MLAFINPGTGPLADTTYKDAEKSIRAFRRELSARTRIRFKLTRWRSLDDNEGRYGFGLTRRTTKHVKKRWLILMPGRRVEDLLGNWVGMPIPPRLYVDGSSWYWKNALDVITGDLR